ncbi:MAG: DUF368 domain-containing protein, partial [Planctomycetaceae bacterium]|nr:DUF368 domain-containing protein [Planctomycetaceae bacterium]
MAVNTDAPSPPAKEQSSETPSATEPLFVEAPLNFGRGLLMGGADIIPGVSGGTVALILGIYERLVTAISRVDGQFFRLLSQRNWRGAVNHLDLGFVIPLGIGILSGVVALGSVMHTLLEDYHQYTLAAFFGLIAASVYLVAKLVPHWKPLELVLTLVGALFAFWIVSRPALAHPPDAMWYVFLCGVLGICAMILPGISGAFILLILGKYHDLTGIIKEVLHLKISISAITTVAVFGTGCLVGLLSFAKLLRWLLHHHGSATMATLCGV